MMRTDSHNNPAAIITLLAAQAGLVLGTDYTVGDPFTIPGGQLFTARLIGDPIALTIRIITAVGYRTHAGAPRWTYICLPRFVWNGMTPDQQRDVIGYHYMNEAGTEMRGLFPKYGEL